MTKEELVKEAEEKYIKRLKQNGCNVEYKNETYIDGYLDSAEPREKRIVELEAEVNRLKLNEQLAVNNGKNLLKENAELEAQIEIMKTRIKEIIFSNDFVNNSPYQNLKKKVRALCDFYKEIKEK